jgi:branched-chain amino acid transport system ATP-binding protein
MEVLHGIDIDVHAGELVAVLGPNGAGKTTLLTTLAGFLRPTSGEVQLDGAPCRTPPHVRARTGVGFVGDDRNVFPSLTIKQNLRLIRRGTDALEQFPPLLVLLNRKGALLSGGEQQMLALARALGTRPRVLIIDELSLGLAPLVRQGLLVTLRQVADEGTAVLIVEQSARAAVSIADRACVLRRGEIIDERPGSDWVAHLDELSSLFFE